MGKPWAKALGPQNTYSVVTILALMFTIPFVLAFDLKDAAAVYNQVDIDVSVCPTVCLFVCICLSDSLSVYLYMWLTAHSCLSIRVCL